MVNSTFLQTPAAAAYLGYSASTFEKMRVRGDGPPYLRLSPRRVIYAVDALDAWARSKMHISTSEYPPISA